MKIPDGVHVSRVGEWTSIDLESACIAVNSSNNHIKVFERSFQGQGKCIFDNMRSRKCKCGEVTVG